ncbi:MAG: hypothetical protein AAF752_12770 [Bacteroidota bacterium]
MRYVLLLLALPLMASAQQPQQPPPCASEPYRHFDFWLGEWEVRSTADSTLAGTNSIQAIENGCGVREVWSSAGGGSGQSLNYYDPVAEEWRQRWVSGCCVIEIAGGWDGETMTLVGTVDYRNGTSFPFRGIWTPLETGQVRQLFEQSADDGETWQVWFDGLYTRAE